MRIAILSIASILVLGPLPMIAANANAAEQTRSLIEIEVVFTDQEIRIIRAHYESRTGNDRNRSGKQKQKSLPPGIAKNLARGKPLPPGIAKQHLPYDLQRALPPVQEGHERIIVAGKILLIEIATEMVRDVLSDVLLD